MAGPPPYEVADQFASNLVRCRKRAGLSQEQLGFLADLHRTEIGMLERGIRLPRVDTLLKLAGGLEIEPGELLDGMGWIPREPTAGHFRLRGNENNASQPEDSEQGQAEKP